MLLARKIETVDGYRDQSLAEHSRRVARAAAQTCKGAGIESLGGLAGLIHDAYKGYGKWQSYLQSGGETVFHAPYAVEFIERAFGAINEPFAALTRKLMSIAVRAHHGGLRDALTPAGEKDAPAKPEYTTEETARADGQFFEEVASLAELEELFRLACAEVGAHLKLALDTAAEPKAAAVEREVSKNEAMLYMGLTQRLLYSALIDADRLDAACCEAGEPLPEDERPDWDAMLKSLEKRLSGFDKSGIGRLRADISEQCARFDAQCGVYRLFVPTGGGKTLSSFRASLNVAKKYGKRRIIYAEPYLTILTQAADELRRAIGETPENRQDDSAVLEFHSNVTFEDDDEGTERELRYNSVAERLDKPVVLTTTVQLLNSLFSGKSGSARRLSAFVNSIIIVDEVQAVPTSSTYLFAVAMNYLARFCGCLIILCTATPPALESVKYPVRMPAQPDVVKNTAELFEAFKRTSIIPLSPRRFTVSELAEFVMERFDESGSCLVIVNTKAVAKKLFTLASKAAPKGCAVYYLSTALCPAHREKTLEAIKKLLPDARVLVVSTQLIEAGVDISFKCVVRSQAGLDSVIQAAGRCNRHAEAESGKVYVCDCVEENLSMLKDIERGKEITGALAQTCPDGALASPETVRRYYEEYFLSQSASLDYEVSRGKAATTLLGYNLPARREFERLYGVKYPAEMPAQSFRTVGAAYCPIAENTTGVVVKYAGSAELLEKLKGSAGKKRLHYSRELRKFCVNVYDNQLQRLSDDNCIEFDKEAGVWVQTHSDYDEATGLDMNRRDSIDIYFQ